MTEPKLTEMELKGQDWIGQTLRLSRNRARTLYGHAERCQESDPDASENLVRMADALRQAADLLDDEDCRT